MFKDRKEQTLHEIAERHGVSSEAVKHLYETMSSGRGTLAQFNHPDLGGMGQWTKGGMLMIGEMFNDALKARVASICLDVAQLISAGSDDRESMGRRAEVDPEAETSSYRSGGKWWPERWGQPSSIGSQNTLRYAFFRKLADWRWHMAPP